MDRRGVGACPPEVESATRTHAARLIGASAAALIGVFVCEMPEGFFGHARSLTIGGAWFAGVIAVLTAVMAGGLFAGRTWAKRGFFVVPTLSMGAFVGVLGSDPLVAQVVILWQIGALAMLILPPERRSRTLEFGPTAVDPISRWMERHGSALRHLVGISLLLSVAVAGFRLASGTYVFATIAAVNAVTVAYLALFYRLLFRAGHRLFLLSFLPLLIGVALALSGALAASVSLITLFFVASMFVVLAHGRTADELLVALYSSPSMLLLTSFAAIIAIGTMLLCFPAASASGVPIDPVDALFTATSATCVTGLIVLDTPVAFSTFGHIVILGLIQMGGLNIMVLSTFATIAIGGRLGMRGERALGEVLELSGSRSAYQLAIFIVGATLMIEAVGAVLLTGAYLQRDYSFGHALWMGVFHSISAFCNAGFALHSDNVMSFAESHFVLGVLGSLIVFGGIGFVVLAAAWTRLRGGSIRPVMFQVRIVVTVTALLIGIGAALFALFEWNGTLEGMTIAQKFSNSVFQSISLRTAGFNSIDFNVIAAPTIVYMLLWMFIGASPGGTGGGIKTTTAAVLFGVVVALFRGQSEVVVARRRIAQDTVYKSLAIAILSLCIAFVAIALLSWGHPDLGLDRIAFETMSALGTVGLSVGATTKLTVFGKYLISFVMFVGRIGPLTFTLAFGRHQARRMQYSEAKLMVG
jgi:trk system potassium uptake protein TrkH